MASFTISTLAGSVFAELPLDDATLDLVVSDLLERLLVPDGAGLPRLLLGPRELGWSERLGDLALAPGTVVTLVTCAPDPEQAAADLMGTEGTSVRLAAARALHALGVEAARQAGELADAVLSDPDAEVAGEALQALRGMGSALKPGSAGWWEISVSRDIAQLAHDLEDPCKLCCEPDALFNLTNRLSAILARCDASPGQAALRGQTVLRRLAPLDPEAARRHEPLLADPLEDARPEVRLAAVAALGPQLREDYEEDAGVVSKLCGVLQGDACMDVRRRAAATLSRACQLRSSWGFPVQRLAGSLELARTALEAEVEALQRSTFPADRCRMEAVQSVRHLLR